MNPRSVQRTIQMHDRRQLAMSDPAVGSRLTYGEFVTLVERFRRTLSHFGVEPGESIGCDLAVGSDLAALLFACLESGLRLIIAGAGARLGNPAAKSMRLLVSRERSLFPSSLVRTVSAAELGQNVPAWGVLTPIDSTAQGCVSVITDSGSATMDAAALARSAANFAGSYPTSPGQTFVSLPFPLTIETLCLSIVIPLTLGMHTVLASETAVGAALAEATWLAVTAEDAPTLIERAGLPVELRAVFCSGGQLTSAERARAEAALGRRLHRGFGTVGTGLWAVSSPIEPGLNDAGQRYTAGIRELRAPLHLIDTAPGSAMGEIVLYPRAEHQPELFTGSVGWLTPAGAFEVVGQLSDVSVRGGRAILLTDLDRLLARHPEVGTSRSFREHGKVPTEPVISVCVTEASEASIRDWVAEQAGPGMAPSRVVTLPAARCAALPPVDVLRSVVTGKAGHAMVAALTARRFRRNPAYDEAGLAAATDRAILSGRPLEFLMFWGCGPRRLAEAPDRAATDALGDLLAAAEAAAPVQARAHVVCTDLHAKNNGHSESHFLTYFSEIRALAGALDVSFELESAVWRRGRLTREAVVVLEAEPAFEERWQRFPLRDRFIHQASRHSGMADKTEAARHYYATCLLEREVLKSMFSLSVFLTYNGPEFNECFPDLPTLYVYPGPRGRNDKPWFVDVDPSAANQAQGGGRVRRASSWPERAEAGRGRYRAKSTPAGACSGEVCDPTRPTPRFLSVGDIGISVQFGTEIDRRANDCVAALDRLIAAAPLRGVIETVPSYRSLLVVFEPVLVERAELLVSLEALAARAGRSQPQPGRRWSIPVVYEPPFGEDLPEVAGLLGLSLLAVVAAHTRAPLRVYMLGFQPGLPNLGGLPPELHVSRRTVPRTPVPGGSVMIGGGQGAIMPLPTPSGFYLLGRTPVRLFDRRRAERALLKAGDTIHFREIGAAEFAEIEEEVAGGNIDAGVLLDLEAA